MMKQAHRNAARQELETIRNQAEAIADTLDPARTFTGRDEVSRTVVKACDQITMNANRALSILRVTEDS